MIVDPSVVPLRVSTFVYSPHNHEQDLKLKHLPGAE